MRKKRILTPEIAAQIKWFSENTDLYQDQIAAQVNQNPGRVSEVLSGKRFSNISPANTLEYKS